MNPIFKTTIRQIRCSHNKCPSCGIKMHKPSANLIKCKKCGTCFYFENNMIRSIFISYLDVEMFVTMISVLFVDKKTKSSINLSIDIFNINLPLNVKDIYEKYLTYIIFS